MQKNYNKKAQYWLRIEEARYIAGFTWSWLRKRGISLDLPGVS